jgi:hypothetical protein
MKIRAYSPKTGYLIANDITGINFGNVRQGQHSIIPVLVRPIRDTENISGLELYLQNDGGFVSSLYGHYTNPDFVSGVRSYTSGITGSAPVISDHFVTIPSPPTFTGGVPINLNIDGEGDYIWLDVESGAYESGSTSTINYRFIFEYS